MVGRADRGTERQTDRKPVRKEVPAAAAKEVVKTIWQRRKKQWWSAGTPATLRVCGTMYRCCCCCCYCCCSCSCCCCCWCANSKRCIGNSRASPVSQLNSQLLLLLCSCCCCFCCCCCCCCCIARNQ